MAGEEGSFDKVSIVLSDSEGLGRDDFALVILVDSSCPPARLGIWGSSTGTDDAQRSKLGRSLFGVVGLSLNVSEGLRVRVFLLLKRIWSDGGDGVAVGPEDCDASEAAGERLGAGFRGMLVDLGPTKLNGGAGSGLFCSRNVREGASGLR